MSNETTNGKKSTSFGEWALKDILEWMDANSAKFVIPDYQRGYAWGERQLVDFWDDLHSPTMKHYTGAITVEKALNNQGENYDVVDGQQRLTTIAILFSALGKDNQLCSNLMYGEHNENSTYFSELLNSDALNSCTGENGEVGYSVQDTRMTPQNVYQRNLIKAKVFFLKKVSELKISKQCLFDQILEKFTFDFRILGADFNSGIVFETMNNRGKPLTLLEKLKNRLIYLSDHLTNPINEYKNEEGEGRASSSLRSDINTSWGEIYRALASVPDREPLDEDEFVAAHLSVYRNPKESVYSELVAESRLFKMFCANPERHPKSEDVDEENERSMAKAVKEETLSAQKIYDYVNDLKKFASAWTAIHMEFDSACGHCRLLSGTREVKTFLAAVWLELDQNTKQGDNEVFKNAEKLLFRNTVCNVIDEASFATLGRRLHGKCLDQIKTKGDDEANIDIKITNDILESTLNNKKRKIDADTLVRVFSDRMERQQSPYGFYGWSGLKYFLFSQEAGDIRLSWDKFGETSLEHVMPQSAAEIDRDGDCKNGWWSRQIREFSPFPEDGSDEKRKKECRCRRRMLVNSLGNFVLLLQSENASVSDGPWEGYPAVAGAHKAVIGKKAFYSDSQHVSSSGARKVAELEGAWNAFRIRERGRGLFKELARSLGVEEVISDERIDLALGFCEVELQDTRFDDLGEETVRELAPQLGTAADNDRGNLDFDTAREFFKALCNVFDENSLLENGDGMHIGDMKVFPAGNRGENGKLYFEIKNNCVILILRCRNADRRFCVCQTCKESFARFFGDRVEIDYDSQRTPGGDGPRYIRFRYVNDHDIDYNNKDLLSRLQNDYLKVKEILQEINLLN